VDGGLAVGVDEIMAGIDDSRVGVFGLDDLDKFHQRRWIEPVGSQDP